MCRFWGPQNKSRPRLCSTCSNKAPIHPLGNYKGFLSNGKRTNSRSTLSCPSILAHRRCNWVPVFWLSEPWFVNEEQPLASTLWLLARFVGNHVGWLVGSSSLRQVQVNVFPKLYWRRRKKLTRSAKALNALFPKPIGTDAIVLTRTKNSANFLFESCISTDAKVLTRR